MLNYVRQVLKTRVVYHALYLWNEDNDPQFFCISDTSNSLSDCSKNFIKIYRLENFRANVFKGALSRCSARANLTGFFHRKTLELSLCRVIPTRQSDR